MSSNNAAVQPANRPPTHHTTAPLADPRNTLTHPEGSQFQLLLSEGVYNLRDEILLGQIPPHHSEAGAPMQNVLDPKPLPPTSGTKLSIAVLAPRQPRSQRRSYPTIASSTSKSSFPSSSTENSHDLSQSSSDNSSSRFGTFGLSGFRFKGGDSDGAATLPNGKDMKEQTKRRKPKTNITKSNSSFISRAIPNEGLSKRLSEHQLDGYFAIANISRALLWLDLSSPNKQEQLMKVLFTKAHALCHDFNEFSKTANHMDVIMGFSTSEILWFEPMSQRYTRINKNGIINSTPVSAIKWIPGSENLFIAAHLDGSLVMYDKEREDEAMKFEDEVQQPRKVTKNGKKIPRLVIRKSIQSKNLKMNPVAYWKTTNQRINAFEFSPDGRLLAVVSEDGSLRILDYEVEQLLDLYSSYYGGLTCVAWSPDGAYILTGGQDDLISIWSIADRNLVARCSGHRSWVASVSFDAWQCDDIRYRFGSVGEDGRLLLWDFSAGTLHRPRGLSVRRSISSIVSRGPDRSNSIVTIKPSDTDSSLPRQSLDDESSISHPIIARGDIAMLPPVLSKEVDSHALSWIRFEEDCLMVACRGGHIRTWDRPTEEDPFGNATTGHQLADPFHSQQ